jgi:hypothetical protein
MATTNDDVGMRLAYIELLKVLIKRKAIMPEDIDFIIASLTNMSARYEMKPDQRASFESFSKALMKFVRREI